jgi:hypothetical protein
MVRAKAYLGDDIRPPLMRSPIAPKAGLLGKYNNPKKVWQGFFSFYLILLVITANSVCNPFLGMPGGFLT